MYNLVDLTDKKIIITGASQGIGRETAILLSKLGAKVCLVARTEAKLQETLGMLAGGGHIYRCVDIRQLDSIEAAVNAIAADFGKLDGLVYCAGVDDSVPLRMLKPLKLQEVLSLNLSGFVEMVRCCTKKQKFNSGMRIVGISSTAAFLGNKAHTAYSASKAGMDGAVRCMAIELAEKGICVNTVAPSFINTAMYQNYVNRNGTDNEYHREILKRQYLGIGETTDVAAAIAFLISPAARFITGVCLPVDGGKISH